MADSRPNVLWIFSDQHSANTIGCYGDPNVETPNLDRLAGEGVRFTNAYSTCPLCAPFRATLYTGQYIHTHGVISLFRPLLPNQPELPEVLRENGYRTSHVGKWHLGGGDCPAHFVSPYFRPGWDDWAGWENSNDFNNTTYSVGDHPHPVHTLKGYQTDGVTDLTIEWMRERADDDQPWFHVMSFEPPHTGMFGCPEGWPNFAPEPYMARFRDKPIEFRPNYALDHPKREDYDRRLRGYYAQIANLDDNVGRLLATLAETEQLDKTMIWYFSDHGDMMGSHGRQQKSRPEEESANIPLIVRHPAKVPAGQVTDALIGAVDFMPTLLASLGMPIPDSVEGQDLSGTLSGAAGADVTLIEYEQPYYPPAPQTAFRSVRWERWLYTYFLTQGPAQLFDLDADPCELNNLIDSPEHAETRTQAQAKLEAKLNEIGDDFLERAAAHQSGPA